LDHQLYQLADLRRTLGGSADDRSLFGLSLNFMRFDYDFRFAGHSAVAHNLSLGPVENLSIAVYDHADSGPVRIDFDANPACHELRDVADHQRRFLRLLEAAVADAGRPIGTLDILGAEERRTILETWNATSRVIAPATLPELFAAQVARTPDATAVVFEGRSLSYRELDGRANALAHHLRSRGVGPEVVVGLCLERSLEMVVGLIAILKAGGAYLPLDPAYPRSRLEYMINDARLRLVLTHSGLAQSLSLPAGTTCIALDQADTSGEPTTAPSIDLDPEHLAYVIYTSGSTGTPKGVVVAHQNVITSNAAREPFYGEFPHRIADHHGRPATNERQQGLLNRCVEPRGDQQGRAEPRSDRKVLRQGRHLVGKIAVGDDDAFWRSCGA
jgi:nonribosomal peptide synthetase DhbF